MARFRCFLARQVVLTSLLIFKEDIIDKTVRLATSQFVASACAAALSGSAVGSGGSLEAPRLCDAGTGVTGLARSDAQVIASLLVSAVMLGVKVTSLNAIIRTINRKQELKMLVAELNLPRSRNSNIPVELMQRARRASEQRPAEMKMVCVAPQPLAVARYMQSHPMPPGDRPSVSSRFCVPTSELDNSVGDSPATDELDVVRFVPTTRELAGRARAVAVS